MEMSQREIRDAIASGNARFPNGGKKKKKMGKRQNQAPEEELQRVCHAWNQLQSTRHPVLAWMFHTPNGGSRTKAEAGVFKATGVKAGVPDFMLPFPSPYWKGLAIELKSDTGALSEKQRGWLVKAHAEGWLVGVVRTLEEYIALVQCFLGGTSLSYQKCAKNIEL